MASRINISELEEKDCEKEINEAIAKISQGVSSPPEPVSVRTTILAYRSFMWLFVGSVTLSFVLVTGALVFKALTMNPADAFVTTMEGKVIQIQPIQ